MRAAQLNQGLWKRVGHIFAARDFCAIAVANTAAITGIVAGQARAKHALPSVRCSVAPDDGAAKLAFTVFDAPRDETPALLRWAFRD